jgi:hypothetical protein
MEGYDMDSKKISIEEGSFGFIWFTVNNSLVQLPVTCSSINKIKNKMNFLLESQYQEYFKSMLGGSLNINFYIPDDSLNFTAEFLSLNEKTLSVSFPNFHKKYDQRKNTRAIIDGEHVEISLADQGKIISKRCYDLSCGGFSIILNKNELDATKRMKSAKAKLHIMGEDCLIGVKLTRVQDFNPSTEEFYKFYKVSYEFQDTKPEYKVKIKKLLDIYFRYLKSS